VFASTKGSVLGEAFAVMDRIDLQVAVNRLKPEEITRQSSGENHQCGKVQSARDRAHPRFKADQVCVAMPRCRAVGSGANSMTPVATY